MPYEPSTITLRVKLLYVDELNILQQHQSIVCMLNEDMAE